MPIRRTGIGGLPFADLDTAMAHVAAHYDLPFLPQLAADPAENMVDLVLPRDFATKGPWQVNYKIPGMGTEDAAFAALNQPWQEARIPLLETLTTWLAHPLLAEPEEELKIQVTGPCTLLQHLRDEIHHPLWVHGNAQSSLSRYLAALAAECGKRALEHSGQVTIWLDEPVLGLPGVLEAEEEVGEILMPCLETLFDLDIRAGLHCCSAPPFHLLALSPLGDFSLDIGRYHAELLQQDRQTLSAFADRGGRLILGFHSPLPSSENEDENMAALFDDILNFLTLSCGFDSDQILISAACGTMLTPVERELEIAAGLKTLSQRWSPAK